MDLIWLAIALPLGGAVVLLLFGKQLGEPRAGLLGTATVAGGFVVAAAASVDFFTGDGGPHVVELFDWIPGLGLNAELLWDPLSAVMTMVVTGVGTLIHAYSIGYMHGDERFGRFFTYLNLFIASMLILVLGANFGLLFVGWELVGLSSYLLISFWYTKPEAAAAGKKAFVVNRIGDFGFMIGLMVIFANFGSFAFGDVLDDPARVLSTGAATAIALLLFVGAAGKSAQFPLHIWLPDAMEGPTPVSALIHAATMVTAGVYMVARTASIFQMSDVASGVVATIGAVTALGAATIALGQRDIKRVLAYSTISQLGYMFMGVGAAAYTAGIFHLYTHAFFKALLFLGAGSVIHAMGGEQDMRKMGGLRSRLPVTFATMAVAWLAISGIPPLAGFWSKDEILAVTFNRGGPWVILWLVGIVTALLTALYMSRLIYLTFWTRPKWDEGVEPHESPRSMTAPLVVLALASVGVGFVNTPFRAGLEHFLEPAFEGVTQAHLPQASTQWVLAALSVAAAVLGIMWATRRYAGKPPPAEESDTWRWARNGYYLDNL
ncbi:MAG: NADH-quinone oxidoreductase subunit L, partial [Acidimicrobiia bacterium]|nr:NADH-quinone oxidoreductase subunit L [Acidimicrobiia bacterium]